MTMPLESFPARCRRRITAGAALALLLLAAAGVASSARADTGMSVTVMTRNLYFGADLTPVIAATTQQGFFDAVKGAYLQGFGVPYTVASADTGYDVEAPGSFPGPFPVYTDVRLTQHDVILARQESRLKITNPLHGQYHAQISLPTVAGPIPLPWAWASVDAGIGGHSFRFATTHLDPDSGAAQVAPAQEFLGGPAVTSLPLVWAGDFNSDADTTTITGIPPDTTTYANIVNAGLTDAWASVHPGDHGYTCCENADLDNQQPTLDQRIDHVFMRGPWHAVSVTIVGADPSDKTAGGLWPSDHAGVVAKLNLQGQS